MFLKKPHCFQAILALYSYLIVVLCLEIVKAVVAHSQQFLLIECPLAGGLVLRRKVGGEQGAAQGNDPYEARGNLVVVWLLLLLAVIGRRAMIVIVAIIALLAVKQFLYLVKHRFYVAKGAINTGEANIGNLVHVSQVVHD
jgi:hypothetical protein